MGKRVLIGHLFFTGGGAPYVIRNLAAALPRFGWQPTIVSASVRNREPQRDARHFFSGLDVRPVDLTDAIDADDPMHTDPPVPPLLTARPGRRPLFAALDDATFEHHVEAGIRALDDAGAGDADILHLHHLTPLNEAAGRKFPSLPVVGHLHGGELLLMEEIERLQNSAAWPHASAWASRLRRWAAACARIVLLGECQLERAERLLGVARADCAIVPNGFDPSVFRPLEIDRHAHWRRHLVEHPQGWAPGGGAGSVRYDESCLDAFAPGNPVLIHVGRYAAVKRLDLLIEAFALAQPRFATRAPLVLVGGSPGECEGEHPLEIARTLRVPDVFLAGWQPQESLPVFLACSDVLVLPSVREQFGLPLIEAMACGRPVIAADALGPAEIVSDGNTGWLVPPGDAGALADALVAAVNDPAERRRRGIAATADAQRRFTTLPLAKRMAAVYDSVLAEQKRARPDTASSMLADERQDLSATGDGPRTEQKRPETDESAFATQTEGRSWAIQR